MTRATVTASAVLLLQHATNPKETPLAKKRCADCLGNMCDRTILYTLIYIRVYVYIYIFYLHDLLWWHIFLSLCVCVCVCL